MNWTLRKAPVRESKETFLSDIHLSKTLIPKTCPQTQLAGGGPLGGCSWTVWGRSKQAIHHQRATELKAWEMGRLGQKKKKKTSTEKEPTNHTCHLVCGLSTPTGIFVLHQLSRRKRETIPIWQHIIPYHVMSPLWRCNEIGINFSVVQTLNSQRFFKVHLPRSLPVNITFLSLSSPAQLPIFILPKAGPNCHAPAVSHEACAQRQCCVLTKPVPLSSSQATLPSLSYSKKKTYD